MIVHIIFSRLMIVLWQETQRVCWENVAFPSIPSVHLGCDRNTIPANPLLCQVPVFLPVLPALLRSFKPWRLRCRVIQITINMCHIEKVNIAVGCCGQSHCIYTQTLTTKVSLVCSTQVLYKHQRMYVRLVYGMLLETILYILERVDLSSNLVQL